MYTGPDALEHYSKHFAAPKNISMVFARIQGDSLKSRLIPDKLTSANQAWITYTFGVKSYVVGWESDSRFVSGIRKVLRDLGEDCVMRVPRVKDFHESKEYDRILAECLRPLGDRIQGFRVDVQNAFHWTAVPATVIAINSHFDVNMRISSRLAVVFSLLYLADHMHYSVKDTDQYSDDYESAQFAILMGDYLFGRAVELLSDVNGHGILPHFSELISRINEGHTMIKAGSYANDLGVIAREKASFYRFAFLTAAVMADCPQTECSVYEEMGQNLGMAVALSANGLVAESQTYLHELENLWRLVPKRHGGASLALRSFLTEIAKGIVPSWEVVAI